MSPRSAGSATSPSAGAVGMRLTERRAVGEGVAILVYQPARA